MDVVRETFCHRCKQVVTVSIVGLCTACGVFIASGASHSGAHVPFEAAISAPASVTPDGPHLPESPFHVHLPNAEHSAGSASVAILDEAGSPILDEAGSPLLDESAAGPR
jgi:hypothetical protein